MGWLVVESDDAGAVHQFSRMWHDLLEFEIYPVIEDAEIAQVIESMG